MDEGEAYRHRQRVVAFALLMGALAALFNAGFVWLGSTSFKEPSPFFIVGPYHWQGRTTRPNPSESRVIQTMKDNRGILASAVLSLLIVTVGCILIEMPRYSSSMQDIAWIALGIGAESTCVIVGFLLKPHRNSSAPARDPLDMVLEASPYFAIFGAVVGLLALIPVYRFRRLDAADWWPTSEMFLAAREAAISALVAGCVFGGLIAFEKPVAVAERVVVLDKDAAKRDSPEWQRGLQLATKDFESELREQTIVHAAPVAFLVACCPLVIWGTGLRVHPDIHKYLGWMVLWMLIGIASLHAGNFARDPYFAPPGIAGAEHSANLAIRGAAIGLTLGALTIVTFSIKRRSARRHPTQ